MSLRDHYENLDKYAMYDYKDVANAYGHGEWDAIDKVLETIDNVAHTAFAAEDYHHNEGGKCVIQLIREAVEALKEW